MVAVFIVQSDSKVVQQVCKDIDPRVVLRCGGLRSRMCDNSPNVSSSMTDTQIRSREMYGVIKNCEHIGRTLSQAQLCSRTRKGRIKISYDWLGRSKYNVEQPHAGWRVRCTLLKSRMFRDIERERNRACQRTKIGIPAGGKKMEQQNR